MSGALETCREELADKRCNERAEFILWGRMFSADALGPRCHTHAVEHTHWSMPSRAIQWAVYDLRPINKAATQ